MDSYISIFHTFKMAANIRPDGYWIAQYGSLFVALNKCGKVIAWQFTASASIDEATSLLTYLQKNV